MAHVSDRWYRKDRTRTPRYGKGLRWQVEWADSTGTKHKKSFEHKVLAEDFLTELRHEQKRGIYRAPRQKLTVAEVFTAWEQSHPTMRPNTAAANRAALRMLQPIAQHDATTITRRDIQATINTLATTYAPNTVRSTYGKLGSAFKWAHTEDLITANPCHGIRLPSTPHKVIDPLTPDDVHRIAQTMRVPAVRAMVYTAAATGLRAGELRAVGWPDITDGQLLVHRQLDGTGTGFAPLKTEASRRRITLGPATLQLLEALRAEHGEGRRGEVFHHNGAAYAARSLIRSWELMRDRSGLQVSGWHQLRHYHASQLIRAGYSPVAVARRLGHRNALQVLTTYAHMWPADDVGMASAGDATLPPPSEPLI